MRQGYFSRYAPLAALAVALLLNACRHPGGATAGPPQPTTSGGNNNITTPPAPPRDCPPPTVDLRANSDTVTQGQFSTLTWTATNADTLTIVPEIGQVPAIGNRRVQPPSSVTYTATGTSPCGSASGVARITVNAMIPPGPVGPPVEVPGNKPDPPIAPVLPIVTAQPPATPNGVDPGRGRPPVIVPPSPPTVRPIDNTQRDPTFAEAVLNILFDYDKSDLREDQISQLQKDAAYLKQHPTVRFTVEGHADERGNQEYNLALGFRRASNVVQYLVSQGVAESRINTVSFGKERPLCKAANPDEGCYQQNRRAAFTAK